MNPYQIDISRVLHNFVVEQPGSLVDHRKQAAFFDFLISDATGRNIPLLAMLLQQLRQP